MDTNILLESGTNELEILEFMVSGNYYGINVAKIREIISYQGATPVPNSHPSIEGIFMPRDTMITAINLRNCLQLREYEEKEKASSLFIITNFNKLNIAFRVHTVVGISRISWEDIQKPDDTISNGKEGVSTGIAQCGGELVTILDFEKIVTEIAPETGIQMSDIELLGERRRCDVPIVLAEDSVLLASMICESLKRAGFSNVKRFNNGKEAWEFLHAIRDQENLETEASLIITDIEMP